jgi:hypothetical protein
LAHADAAPCRSAGSAPRIRGLERLYFRHIDGPLDRDPSVTNSIGAATLRVLMPATLRGTPRDGRPLVPADTDRELSVRDFPISGNGAEWLLREVRDTSHRITEQWWVLYEKGCRVDAWYFTPDPRLTDDKLLTDVGVVAVSHPAVDRLVLSVAGRMDRPAGAWWEMSGDLLFSLAAGTATLQRVANRTSVFHDYDRGTAPITLSAVVERDVTREGKQMVEVRTLDGIDEPDGEPCLDPEKATTGLAACLIAKPGVQLRYRPIEEPSPIERRP